MNSKLRGDFLHNVYFWLKNPDNLSERNTFEASLKACIKQSEFVKTHHIGTPAGIQRVVVNNSYTYCLSVTFDNKDMHDNYQVEPGHKKFIEECAQLWDKVVIYDSIIS